jgi:hypothetical protein
MPLYFYEVYVGPPLPWGGVANAYTSRAAAGDASPSMAVASRDAYFVVCCIEHRCALKQNNNLPGDLLYLISPGDATKPRAPFVMCTEEQ